MANFKPQVPSRVGSCMLLIYMKCVVMVMMWGWYRFAYVDRPKQNVLLL